MKSYKNKILIQNTITYALVIAAFLLIQILMAGGHINSLLKGILVPLCTYVILAVSLNLTVGILGDFAFTGSLLVLSVYYVLFPVGCSCIYPDGKSGK